MVHSDAFEQVVHEIRDECLCWDMHQLRHKNRIEERASSKARLVWPQLMRIDPCGHIASEKRHTLLDESIQTTSNLGIRLRLPGQNLYQAPLLLQQFGKTLRNRWQHLRSRTIRGNSKKALEFRQKTVPLDNCQQQFFFVAKVMIHQPLRDTRSLSKVRNRGRIPAFFGKHAERRINQLNPTLLGLLRSPCHYT